MKAPDLSTVQPGPTNFATEELLDNSPDFVIGAALGPNPNGSIDYLLDALSNLRKTRRPAKLVIFGPRDPRLLAKVAAIHRLGVDVRWVPDEWTTPESLQECGVMVSLQDGVPLSVLRALASGVPIITTAVRIPEALLNQPAVTFIRDGDQQGLPEALHQLREQPQRIPTSLFAAMQNATKHYSDTYLWRGRASPSTDGRAANGHVLIKKALYGAIPNGKLLEHGTRERAQIALTIDDGPDPVHTPRMLDILRDHAVKATFFVVGGAAEQYPEIVLRIKNEGHEVGSHSYSHPYFNMLSWSGAIREIRTTQWILNRILGEQCKLFRPPHGKLSLRSLLPAWAAGQQVVMWNVDLKDYLASPGEVESRLHRTTLSSGDIILYHGINQPALQALPHVIKAALDENRRAVTISEFTRP